MNYSLIPDGWKISLSAVFSELFGLFIYLFTYRHFSTSLQQICKSAAINPICIVQDSDLLILNKWTEILDCVRVYSDFWNTLC